MKAQQLKKLQKDYEKVVEQYIIEFCKKQEIDFEFWVGDIIGGIAHFGDVLYFNFMDIVWDINTKQKKHEIIDWLYYCIDDNNESINYYSYTKGLRIKKKGCNSK